MLTAQRLTRAGSMNIRHWDYFRCDKFRHHVFFSSDDPEKFGLKPVR